MIITHANLTDLTAISIPYGRKIYLLKSNITGRRNKNSKVRQILSLSSRDEMIKKVSSYWE